MDKEQELKKAVEEIKEGNKDKAREILQTYIKANPTNETGWYIYARVAETIEQRIYCLEKAVDINPFYKDSIDLLQKAKTIQEKKHRNTAQNGEGKKGNKKSLMIIAMILAAILLIAGSSLIYNRFFSSQDTISVLTLVSQNLGVRLH